VGSGRSGLIALLAADVTVFGDGGGQVPSAPIVGAQRVARALIGWARQARERGFRNRLARVDGEPGAVFYGSDGRWSGWPRSRSRTG
jgi:RNA polymerase sigma-70 factor (ECF subfamily)